MQLEKLTVRLRPRTGWEAMELGTALLRRHAGAVFKPWLLVSLPVFALANLIGWATDAYWLAWLLMWWLKPVFDRIPLYVLSRAVFGEVPGTRDTLQAQRRWGWRPMLHYLSWRRLSPARALYLPIDLLEGSSGADAGLLRERRRVLGGVVYGNATLLTIVCLHFELAIALGALATLFFFVPFDYLPEAGRAAWALATEKQTWWSQVGLNAFAWLAVTVVEPFYVAAGLGLYLNRRTQIEAWDVEIVFRQLRRRLLAAANPWLLVLALLAGNALLPARAQQADPVAAPPVVQDASAPQAEAQDEDEDHAAAVTLAQVFGDQVADDAGFRRAADQAYQDPLLGQAQTRQGWERNPEPEDDEAESPWNPSGPWLQAFGGVFAFFGEWGLWLLVAVLVVVVLALAPRWWPWMRGHGGRRQAPLPEMHTHALEIPEALPEHVPATARRLWRQGQPRQALALLYRASVESMSERAGVVLVPGATEAECLRASRRQPQATDRERFARMVRVWQYAAYAWQLPAAEDFEALLVDLQQGYGWPA